MLNLENKKGFLGIFPRWADLLVLCLCLYGFVWLQWWSLPRQPAFLTFIISLESIVFLLSFFFPSRGLFLVISVIPGITTSSLTVFNKINPKITIGVFGPAALIPALAFVFGLWLRTSLKKEKLQPNLLRGPLYFFMGLSVLSAFVTLWRYSGFWPMRGWDMVDHVVNIDGLTAGTAKQNIIWVLTNYLTGPLLFLAICQASWLKIKTGQYLWRNWLLKFIIAPLFIGSAAPLIVGFIQKNDVWFGAHKFYIWPWMNRINSTFFDPNALGSYLIIAIPMALAAMALLISLRRWLILPAIISAGSFIFCCIILMISSGSRISFVGLILFIFFVLMFFIIVQIEKLKTKISPKFFISISALLIIIYLCLIYFVVYSSPQVIRKIKNNPKLSKTTLARRFDKMKINSVSDIYYNIKKDRGVYATIAVKMINEMPLTGVGLGSFISELPNYRKLIKELVYVPDTACNYYLQIGSEQGLIALAAVFLIFGVWIRKWWTVMHNAGLRLFWIFAGSGVMTMLVVFLFGMHTLAHEIQCLFWICLAPPFIAQPEGWKIKLKSKYLRLLILFVCIIYSSMAISKLSLEKQKKRFGWKDKSRFYQWEKWPDPKNPLVRYSKKESSEKTKCEGFIFEQKWCALYPDIKKNPVSVKFQLGNQSTNFTAADNDWHTLKILVNPDFRNKKIKYSVSVNRTWKASNLGMNNDKRKLGLLLNKYVWKTSDGLYKKEKWQNDGSIMSDHEYRWTGKKAEMEILLKEKYIKIPLLISHPDVTDEPVRIYIGSQNINLTQTIAINNSWQEIILFCGKLFKNNNKNAVLNFRVSRTINPSNFGIDDDRDLGVAIGNPIFITDFGFYGKEKWKDDFNYRWAGKSARWAEKANSNGVINIFYLVSHPDITNNPVNLSFYLNGEEIVTKNLTNSNWQEIQMHANTNSWNDINAIIDRTWLPETYNIDDKRELGFAIKCK